MDVYYKYQYKKQVVAKHKDFAETNKYKKK